MELTRGKMGFSVSSRFGCPELVDAFELTMKLGSAHLELKEVSPSEQWRSSRVAVVREDDHLEQGFHELDLLSHKLISWVSGQGAPTGHGGAVGDVSLARRQKTEEEVVIFRVAERGVWRRFAVFQGWNDADERWGESR